MGNTIHTNEILNNGMECLTEELGIVEAQRFISIIKREQIDTNKCCCNFTSLFAKWSKYINSSTGYWKCCFTPFKCEWIV